mgnify:FL=1
MMRRQLPCPICGKPPEGVKPACSHSEEEWRQFKEVLGSSEPTLSERAARLRKLRAKNPQVRELLKKVASSVPSGVVGEWRPAPAQAHDVEMLDVFWVRGIPVGYVITLDGSRSAYPYIFNIRLGSYRDVAGAKAEVQSYAALAMPLINKLAERGYGR